MKQIYLLILLGGLSLSLSAQTIRVGNDDTPPTSGSQFRSPYSAVYDYSFVQTIYLQSEIDYAGNIYSISYNFFGPSLANSNELEIYMKEVDYDEFDGSYTDWEPISGMTKVFDGTINPGTLPGWFTIPLQTPFEYNNTGNLLICIFEKSDGSDYDSDISDGNAFGVTDVGTRRVMYFVDDGKAPDPNDPPEADNYRTRIGNIILSFVEEGAAPVTLSSFEGLAQANSNKLSWTTASEQNNKGFEVQSSVDGVEFAAVGFVESKGGSQGNSYEFFDNNPFAGATFYRLKQVDKDGKSEFTRVISVKNTIARTVSVNMLYPNPVKNRLKVDVTANSAAVAGISVTNLEGKVVVRKTVNLIPGNNKIELDMPTVPKGVYIMKMEMNETRSVITRKFLKE